MCSLFSFFKPLPVSPIGFVLMATWETNLSCCKWAKVVSNQNGPISLWNQLFSILIDCLGFLPFSLRNKFSNHVFETKNVSDYDKFGLSLVSSLAPSSRTFNRRNNGALYQPAWTSFSKMWGVAELPWNSPSFRQLCSMMRDQCDQTLKLQILEIQKWSSVQLDMTLM